MTVPLIVITFTYVVFTAGSFGGPLTTVEVATQQLRRAADRYTPSTAAPLPVTYSPLRDLLMLGSLSKPLQSAARLPPPLLTAGRHPAWLSFSEPLFGKYIVLAKNLTEDGKLQLFHGLEASPLQLEVVSAVLNTSYLLPFRGLAAHDDHRDLVYLIKEDAAAASADILQLRRLGGRANLTVHEGGEGGSGGSKTATVVDVRLHLEAAVLNIRYGTSVPKETARLLRHALRALAPRVWERETENSARWTGKERRQLEATGVVPGYELEYRHSPLSYPELYGDPLNVQVVKSGKRSPHDRHREQ